MEKNETLLQCFEWNCPPDGRQWQYLEAQVKDFSAMGITGLWLPPAYKGTRGKYSEGYDVYDLYDLGEFDQKGTVATKYGTKEEYISLIRSARAAGIAVYADIVMNHMGGAEETERIRAYQVDPDNRNKIISGLKEIEAYTRFVFPGRGAKYSTFQWNATCFTGVDHAIGEKEKHIYLLEHAAGQGWKNVTGKEKGNFDFLILNDIETRNPAVREELKKWGRWYHNETGFDGVRIDAVKHMDPAFLNEWLDYMRAEVNPGLKAIGEFWLSDDLPVLLEYLKVTGGRMRLFDAPLHHNIVTASLLRHRYDLRRIWDDTLTMIHPQAAVTFIDNHDTQPLQSLEEFTAQWFRAHAYALILLRQEGLPCVFYPDLFGSADGDPEPEGRCPQFEAVKELRQLLMVRNKHAYGPQHNYFDAPDCIGWTRTGEEDNPDQGCAVLLSNNPERTHTKDMYVGKKMAGRRFENVTGNGEAVQIDENGHGHFSIVPAGVGVWCPV
ncbi:alpha-amylase [Nostoc ellipsosporum NOK]|nr:alpha-amylase [Nostoc ellipsosporum NOK]